MRNTPIAPKRGFPFVPAVVLALAMPSLAGGDPAGDGLLQEAPQEPAQDWVEWLKEGKFWLSFRVRWENVDQDGFAKDADAYTLRSVLGYETPACGGFSGTLEFEDVSSFFGEDYNSTTNGKTQFPTVVDPEDAEINQAFVTYAGSERWSAKLGRQRIALDNHRFIGNVGWRQNEQTFDAALVAGKIPGGIDGLYAYVNNVNRVTGDGAANGDLPTDTHVLHFARGLGPVGSLAAYLYSIDAESSPTFSTDTYGARISGKHAPDKGVGFDWAAELAAQEDAADNPNDVDQDYWLAELGARYRGFSLLVGNEVLGGSGNPGDAFQTPLATGHAFNGWADKFLTTPDTGLEDVYVSLGAELKKAKFQAVWHDFQADSGGADYGTELDLMVTYPIRKEVTVGAKLADYDAEQFATDTTKMWLWMTVSI
jgi:hypothetical protein